MSPNATGMVVGAVRTGSDEAEATRRYFVDALLSGAHKVDRTQYMSNEWCIV